MSDITDTTTTTCTFHPGVETTLRCSRCDRPICSRCAVLTPTGYRCKDCVRGQQRQFETAQWFDYPLAFGVAALLGFAGSLIVTRLGFFTLFLAPVAGTVIAEVVRRIVSKRRSKRLFQGVAAAAVIGSLPLLVLALLSGNLFGMLWPAFYTFTLGSTVYYRLGGIQIR